MKLTAALQISQILRPAALILTSILLSKTGISMTEIGNFESLFFIGTTLSYFWINGLMQGVLSFMPSVSESERPSFFFYIALIFNVLSLLLFLLFYIFQNPILYFLTGQTDLPFFSLFAIHLLFTLPAFFLESRWTVENRPLSILAFSVVSNLGFTAVVITPLCLGFGFELSFYGLVTLGLLRFIWLWVSTLTLRKLETFAKLSPPPKSELKQFIKLSLPLIAYSLLNGFVMAFVSWLVSWWSLGNKETFAIFRFGAREFPLVIAMTTGLSNAFVAKIADFLTETTQNSKLKTQNYQNTEGVLLDLKTQTLKLWHLLFPISIALMLLAKPLFPIVFNPQFAQSSDIFCIFLLLITSRALFPQTILLALKETKTLLWFSILETLVVVIAGFLLINWWGTEGVAWALVLGFLVEKIGIAIFLKRRYSIDFQSYTQVGWYFFYVGLLLVSYFFR